MLEDFNLLQIFFICMCLHNWKPRIFVTCTCTWLLRHGCVGSAVIWKWKLQGRSSVPISLCWLLAVMSGVWPTFPPPLNWTYQVSTPDLISLCPLTVSLFGLINDDWVFILGCGLCRLSKSSTGFFWLGLGLYFQDEVVIWCYYSNCLNYCFYNWSICVMIDSQTANLRLPWQCCAGHTPMSWSSVRMMPFLLN